MKQPLHLHISMSGPDGHTTWQFSSLKKRMIKIGRLASADVCLEHESIARLHASIELVGATARIWQLGGGKTILNGQFVSAAVLPEHATLQLGDLELCLTLEREPRQVEESQRKEEQPAMAFVESAPVHVPAVRTDAAPLQPMYSMPSFQAQLLPAFNEVLATNNRQLVLPSLVPGSAEQPPLLGLMETPPPKKKEKYDTRFLLRRIREETSRQKTVMLAAVLLLTAGLALPFVVGW